MKPYYIIDNTNLYKHSYTFVYMETQTITPEIKKEIEKTFWIDEDGKTRLSLGNHRLDFEQDYFFVKFTQKGIRLYWLNGTEKVFVVAKLNYNSEYKDFSIYTEGWNYIKRLNIETPLLTQ